MRPMSFKDSRDRTQRPTMSVLTATLILAAGLATPAIAGGREFSWQGGDGFWLSNNWNLNGAPALFPPATFGVQSDIVQIGNLPGVQNSTVQLGFLDGEPYSVIVARAEISHGMTLDLSGSRMLSTGGLSLEGGSRLLVRPTTPLYSGYSGRIDISSDSQMELFAGSEVALVGSASVNWGLISGRGKIVYLPTKGGAGAGGLINNGTISGLDNGGLWLQQLGNGRLDLDGTTGNGQVLLASPFSQLRIQGDQLTDSFSGTVTMGTGSLLDVDLNNGWTADTQSTFNVSGSVANTATQIDGGHFTFGGDLNIGGSNGYLRVLADTTLISSADVFLGNSDRLEFAGQTEIQGGVYQISQAGRIDFDARTDVGGGVFNMVGNSVAQGVVKFNGETDWHGNTTFNGVAQQIGNAIVSGSTVVNASTFDMDGNNNAHWDINSSLVVNTNTIELSGSQVFDGTLDITDGIFGRFNMNLADPSESWTMNGQMNLAGFGGLTTQRVTGSRMIVTGNLNTSSGVVDISADTAFNAANVEIANGAVLQLGGDTSVNALTDFDGQGNLRIGINGSILFDSGVTLNQVGLINNGLFEIGQDSAGVASVDRILSSASAVWTIDIGGYIGGTEYDLLKVTGGDALLNGSLEINLTDLMGELFTPMIGDEFTILTSFGDVNGTFLNEPVSYVGPLTYEWEVLYNPHSVVIRLDSIVPAPGCIAILTLGSMITMPRRRQMSGSNLPRLAGR